VKRRDFIGGLAAAAAWPILVRAQQPSKIPFIGFLGQSTPSAEKERAAAFVQRLSELGWVDGHNIKVEYRWGEGRTERFAEIAAEFVRLKVDLIVASGTANVAAAKRATSIIPIVFAVAGNPVANNLVASLARPGGNVTGLSTQATDLAAKRLEVLKDVVPGLNHLAIVGNVANPLAVLEITEVQQVAGTLGLRTTAMEIKSAGDISAAFKPLEGANALYVVADPLVNTNRDLIQNLAMEARLPAIYNAREHVEAGGLISYGPNFADLYRRAADFVDRIVRGAEPGEIPVEEPTKFDLAINIKTAKTLGLTVPEELLARADKVIE